MDIPNEKDLATYVRPANPTEHCWETGDYTDECVCDLCDHMYECSASTYGEDDD